MTAESRSYHFKHAIAREPSQSVISGLRSTIGIDPTPEIFKQEHQAYVRCLTAAGIDVIVLPPLEDFPDSVFVEDVAFCIGNVAIVLRPGAQSRRGETLGMLPILQDSFEQIVTLPEGGFVDGGDVLLAESHVFIGLSERTNQAGFDAFSAVLSDLGYTPKLVETPHNILHFKTACGVLDAETIFATERLARTQCFDGYQVILAPNGEDAAANLIRVNDIVMISAGYPKTKTLLQDAGFNVQMIPTSQAALIDGGLSCMSLRF